MAYINGKEILFSSDVNVTDIEIEAQITGEAHTVESDSKTNHVSGKKNTVKDKVHKTTGTTVGGEGNTVDGAQNANVHGKGNKILGSEKSGHYGGSQSTMGGLNNTIDARGNNSDCPNVNIHGEGNTAKHRSTDIAGKGNNTSAKNQFVRGTYCADNPKALFILGCGTSDSDRRNALEVVVDNGVVSLVVGGVTIETVGNAEF